MTGEMKCPRLYLCLAHSIPSPTSMQHMHQHDQQWYDPLHIITWSYWFIDLDFTCSSPLPRSIGTKSSLNLSFTLQPVYRAKLYLDLLHLDQMTQCHVSCAMSSFIIICVSFATSPSHFHLHGICCSQTCTCGLMTCVSHINTISPPRVVTQLPKPHKNLSTAALGQRLCHTVALYRYNSVTIQNLPKEI